MLVIKQFNNMLTELDKICTFCFALPLFFLNVADAQDRHVSLPVAQERIRNGVIIADGAICDNRVPAYFVMDTRGLMSGNYIEYSQVTEPECIAMCSDNLDLGGKPILCASFTYSSITKKCFIHRGSTAPSGIIPLTKFEKGRRYYEKFCLPKNAPLKCGETPFFREQQAILVGFAKNVSLEENMEACAAKCILLGSKCKSAMFFYEEGECIVNSDAALNQGESFVDEEVDKVVYFENGCVMDKQIRSQKGAVISVAEEEQSANDDALIDALILNEKLESEGVKTQPFPSSTSSTSTTTTTAVATTTSTTTSTTTTATTSTTTVTPKPEKSLPSNNLNVRSDGWDEWGAWTFCDKSDGRRVRRRKCLSPLKSCKGPKMETQWCSDLNPSERRTAPRITVAPPTRRHVAKLRLPLRNIMPDLTGRNLLPVSAWGPWNQECVDFAVVQPCRSGNRLGFQNRRCNGFPFQCEGPFFRYCFLPC